MFPVPLAFATAKSLGDFVIAHSVLHRLPADAKKGIRLISSSCVEELQAILPADVNVTLVESGGQRVPALFDLKKRGALAAARSALSLRREFRRLARHRNELLAFMVFGARERFIAGGWPVLTARAKGPNIYATYQQFLAEQGVRTAAQRCRFTGNLRTVGIFPESRLAVKRLDFGTLSVIFQRLAHAGARAKLFILEGDESTVRSGPDVVCIPRNFRSLAQAIESVDAVISADSLPAHLAEYLARPVFVATPVANEYWLPYQCFQDESWGTFRRPAHFSRSLDRFLSASAPL